MASNYAQILTSIAFIKKVEDFESIRKLLLTLKGMTNNYSEFLNPRDMAEIVAAVCKLYIIAKPELKSHQPLKHSTWDKKPKKQVEPKIKNADTINFEKELRLLAKRSALMLGAMNKKSQGIVVDHFELIDFYDADFTEAMKRLKIIP